MTTSSIRTQFCPECGTTGVAAYPDLEHPVQEWQWWLTLRDGRRFLEPMRAPAPGHEPPRLRCYLVQPDPEHPAQLLASELRPAQVHGARAHGQQFYREHTRVACHQARQNALTTT